MTAVNPLLQLLINRIRAPSRIAMTIALAVTGGALVLSPPYVRSPGHMLALELSCVPERIALDFGTDDLRLTKAEITVDQLSSSGVLQAQVMAPSDLFIAQESGSTRAQISLQESTLPSARTAAASDGPIQTKVVLMFRRVPAVDIRTLEYEAGTSLQSAGGSACTHRRLSASEILQVLPEDAAADVKYTRRVQEIWADYLLLFNPSIGNLLLALLSLVLLWSVWRMFRSATEFWSGKSSALEAKARDLMAKHPGKSVEALKNDLAAAYSAECWWPNFWKIMGPALGFLLTVSSLAAALHPSVQSSRDGYAFVSAIEIAVVSTFVGLAVRIFAYLDTSLRLSTLRKLGYHLDGLCQDESRHAEHT